MQAARCPSFEYSFFSTHVEIQSQSLWCAKDVKKFCAIGGCTAVTWGKSGVNHPLNLRCWTCLQAFDALILRLFQLSKDKRAFITSAFYHILLAIRGLTIIVEPVSKILPLVKSHGAKHRLLHCFCFSPASVLCKEKANANESMRQKKQAHGDVSGKIACYFVCVAKVLNWPRAIRRCSMWHKGIHNKFI